ncbi:putative late blight resistance protein homolog R1A-3 [Coffea arabica]|uniref:Late blight resistance protein homolog R1A-3 n=1 Tax=Coffea arabica TaxID=13443 RepID=A0A6P6VB60_COFAR
MASTSNYEELPGCLGRLAEGSNSSPSSSDKVHRLKVKVIINILRHFLQFSLKWHIEDNNVRVRLNQIMDGIHEVIQDCQLHDSNTSQVAGNEDCRSSRSNHESVVSHLKKVKDIKPVMLEICSIADVTTFGKRDTFRSIKTKNTFLSLKNFPRSMMPSLINSQIARRLEFCTLNVVSFVDSLLDNLKDILSHNADLVTPVEEQIGGLECKLRFFRNFLWFIANRCIKQRKLTDLRLYAENLAVYVACLIYFCLVDDKMHENMVQEMKTKLVDLVEKINPLKPEARKIYLGALKTSKKSHDGSPIIDQQYLAFVDYLIDNLREVSRNQALFLFAEEDQMEILLDELKLLRLSLMDPPLYEDSDNVRALTVQIKAVMNKIGHSFYFFYLSEINKDMAGQLNLVLSGILKDIERVKGQAADCFDKFIMKSWRSNFPRTNEPGFIEFLMKKLKEQLHHEESQIRPFKHQIGVACEELESLRIDITEIGKQLNHNEELNVLLELYKDISYQAEYIVDSLEAEAGSLWCHKLGLFNVIKEIRHIHKRLKAIRKEEISNDTPAPVLAQANFPNIEAMPDYENDVGQKTEETTIQLVGFEVAAEKIKEQLTRGSNQLNILTIVGMPGIGKTTLANSLYKDHSVSFSFHTHAWCCVSRVYHKQTLLLEILGQINRNFNRNPGVAGKDYVEMLYKSLKGKRYLLVIDDIWDIEAWNDLKEVFPDDHNGSRILFTTRNYNIALKANSVPYALSPISDEESWQLLCIKVFEEEMCPSELLQVGKRIAKICKGLPLSVVSVSGTLKAIEREQDRWEQVAESLWLKEPNNPLGQHSGILELCYHHLPNFLKPCFLYFGGFREDAVIPVSKLLWLWIAEGFIHQTNPSQKSLKNEAENFLNDLIDRNLVMVAERSSRGRVKSCHVHDLLHDFCLAKSEEENFLLHMKRYDQRLTTSADSVMHEAYRLCIHSDKYVVPPGPLRARSLFFWSFLSNDRSSMLTCALQFRLLRVLDLSHIHVVSGVDEQDFIKITNLVHLRYLAIWIGCQSIPSEIENLQNLESLILMKSSTRYFSIKLPNTIWNLVNLRHLNVRKNDYELVCFYLPYLTDHFWDLRLDKLESISTIEVYSGYVCEHLMSVTPNLRKLSCMLRGPCFPSISELNQVEELNLCFWFEMEHPLQFNSASNLKKLTLSNMRRPWDEISFIGELPNLEVLKLNEGAFVGRQWDMAEGGFQKLKFLKLCKLDIQVWNASADDLPCLERLVLHGCLSLWEIPSSALAEMSTLQSIEIIKCMSPVWQSAMQILNEQHEMGNDEFKVSFFR